MDTQNQKPAVKFKKAWLIIIIFAIILIGVWLLTSKQLSQKTGNEESQNQETAGNQSETPAANENQDTTANISGELQGVDLGDVEQEFKNIDSDLNAL